MFPVLFVFFLIAVLEMEAQQDSCVQNINDLNARFPQDGELYCELYSFTAVNSLPN
jgi:hypothetical protein